MDPIRRSILELLDERLNHGLAPCWADLCRDNGPTRLGLRPDLLREPDLYREAAIIDKRPRLPAATRATGGFDGLRMIPVPVWDSSTFASG